MESLKLEDLIPEEGQFTLSATKKTYHLRPLNLADEAWIKKTFHSSDAIAKMFRNMDFFQIAQIAYHQMVEDDKRDFRAQKVKIINELGQEVEADLGGYELLFHVIAGWKEKYDIMAALLSTIGISRPTLDKLEQEQVKKHEDDLKKKMDLSQGELTGAT